MADFEHARAMLRMAHKDFNALTGMLDGSLFADKIFGFHIQQAVEKALKAWLCIRDTAYPSTHARLGAFVDLAGKKRGQMSSCSDPWFSSLFLQFRRDMKKGSPIWMSRWSASLKSKISARCWQLWKKSSKTGSEQGDVEMDWKDRIEVNPAVLVGKPVIKGTRISVGLILDRLADGWSTRISRPPLSPQCGRQGMMFWPLPSLMPGMAMSAYWQLPGKQNAHRQC